MNGVSVDNEVNDSDEVKATCGLPNTVWTDGDEVNDDNDGAIDDFFSPQTQATAGQTTTGSEA